MGIFDFFRGKNKNVPTDAAESYVQPETPIADADPADPDPENEREEQEYFDAGIQIHRKDGKAEEYYYQGSRITQTQADSIADFLIEQGRCPSLEEI